MKVLITGGTGFVGSHTVAALIKQGHSVRLLVRSEDRVEPALSPHGVNPSEVQVGDVTDRNAVTKALTGCEAVIHAANVFTFDPGRVETMNHVNQHGTELVLGEAVQAGLDPIVHVSSFVALLPSDGPITPDSEVGTPEPAYSNSKAVADLIARRLQADGHPVVIIYPGSVWGPDDPYLGESAQLVKNALQGKMRVLNGGNLPISDVRDVAAALVAVLEPGGGPRRYVVVGHNIDFRAAIARVGELAGRNLWSIPVPHGVAIGTGRLADWARNRFGIEPAISFEAPWLLANGDVAESSAAVHDLGIEFTPLDTTMLDTVVWLHRAGHITDRQAGTLATPRSP